MIARLIGLACLLALALPAAAQELSFDIRHTRACLDRAGADAEGQRACVGTSANRCMDATPMGSTTVGMGGCIDRELQWWDARLNAAYQRLMARERADDAQFQGMASVPPKAPALRDMQRAWIPFRDATCAYERSWWGGGTGGGPATLGCLLRMTAEQTLYLEKAGLE